MNNTEIQTMVEQTAGEMIRNLFPEQKPILITEGKSYGTRRAFSDEKQTLMNTLVQLVGSLKGNLDQQLIKDSIAAYDDLKDEFKNALMGLLKSYQNEEITAEAFTKQVQAEIKRAWAEAYQAGVGSVGNPLGVFDEDFSWLKGARQEEYGYLKQFVDDMENDEGVMDFETRMGMYVDTLDSIFNHGKVEASPDNVEIWWELDPDPSVQHCATCLERGDPDNNPYTKDTLPGVPGSDCECLSHCLCHLRIVQTGELSHPGMGFVRAIETKPPRIPEGKRLPTWEEYEKLSQWTTEIDRLRGMIDATSGEVQKEFIKARKELNHTAIEYEKEHGIYYIPGSQFFKGSENPFLKESLDDGPGPGKIPEGYRSPTEWEKSKIDVMILEVNDLRRKISSSTNGNRRSLIAQRFRLNEQVIDFMEKHKIYYLPEAFLPSTSPAPGKALVEQLAQGIVRNLFGAGK